MTCPSFQEYQDLLALSLDGALSPSERVRLDAHLDLCAACRRTLAENRRLDQAAGRWMRRTVTESDPGEAWTAAVLAQVAARPAPVPDRRRLLLAWAALGACLVLLCVLPTALSVTVPNFGSVRSLPFWLLRNGLALPADAAALWSTARAAPFGPWNLLPLWGMLAIAGLLNLLFAARAVSGVQRKGASR